MVKKPAGAGDGGCWWHERDFSKAGGALVGCEQPAQVPVSRSRPGFYHPAATELQFDAIGHRAIEDNRARDANRPLRLEIQPDANNDVRKRTEALGEIGGHNRIVVSSRASARQSLSAQG